MRKPKHSLSIPFFVSDKFYRKRKRKVSFLFPSPPVDSPTPINVPPPSHVVLLLYGSLLRLNTPGLTSLHPLLLPQPPAVPCRLQLPSSSAPPLKKVLPAPLDLKVEEGQEGPQGHQMMHLKDIVPSAANSVNTKFILLEKGNIRASKKCVVVNGVNKIQETKECLTLVADESASVYFLLWNAECEAFEPGDIIHLSNGIFSYHRNKLVLRSGRKGKAEKVGEFTMLFVEKPNMSDIQCQANENDLKKLTQESVTSTELHKSPS